MQASVVQEITNSIRWINLYQVNNRISFSNTSLEGDDKTQSPTPWSTLWST